MKNLDKDEQAILDSFESDEFEQIDSVEEEIKNAKKAAEKYLSKDSRINIRLSSTDLNILKRLAAQEGLPYQTFIASILHKYAAGSL